MFIYAGIDEAGYGPMFGPLVVGRMVLAVPSAEVGAQAAREWYGPVLWEKLSLAVCRDLTGRRGRIAVNDSKKLHTAKNKTHEQTNPHKHIEHLERGVLAFASLKGEKPGHLGEWLDALGERTHRDPALLPWYAPGDDHGDGAGWTPLPLACSTGEIGVARAMLSTAAGACGLSVIDLAADVVFEDRFNRLVAATRSKASTSFTFVAGHLDAIWKQYGEHRPVVVVDRQSGRMHYRELLSYTFPDALMTVLEENPQVSAYRLTAGERAMTVRFEVESEQRHMPVALASMVCKYTRELLMSRFQAWFRRRAPHVKPTAGYALDAKRFWHEIQPVLPDLSIDPAILARSC